MPSLYIGEQPVRTVALASNNDDATAVAADVMKDKIAYNQYGKIVGTAEPAEDLDSEMTAQDSLIEQIKSAVASKASVSYPTLSNPASAGNIESGYQAIGQDGSVIEGTMGKGYTNIETIANLAVIQTQSSKNKTYTLDPEAVYVLNLDTYYTSNEIYHGIIKNNQIISSNAIGDYKSWNPIISGNTLTIDMGLFNWGCVTLVKIS